jgi:cytochrome b pre-mRNA-processing protein 3
LNPLHPLKKWRGKAPNAAKLYGAIVAQARLPVFYQDLAVPDTLEGRFFVLSLHLFAVLHRLKAEAGEALNLAQELADRFSEDLEIVLREIGVGDLTIPKKMRGLASSSASLLRAYEEALAAGDVAVAAAFAKAFPGQDAAPEAATRALASYLMRVVRALEAQSLAALAAGEVKFPGTIPGDELGGHLP